MFQSVQYVLFQFGVQFYVEEIFCTQYILSDFELIEGYYIAINLN